MNSTNRLLTLTPTLTPPKTKPKTKPVTHNDNMVKWANGGVLLMATLSAALNGYANSQHATVPAAGWGMGLVIPLIVLVLAKVAGKQLRRKQRRRAAFTAAAGVGLLALSVWHCAISISLLTSGIASPGALVLALPMAIAIDCGLVSCEVATLDA